MSVTGLIAFDLEIASDIQQGMDWKSYRPLGISCAAVAYRHTGGSIIYNEWYGAHGVAMNSTELRAMVNKLLAYQRLGLRIVTVNGVGFDFDILAEESGMFEECVQLTMNHIDLCFMALCYRGHFLGLDAMAKGAGVEGKLHRVKLHDGTYLDDMGGAKAPELWRKGERSAVLEYLRDDVRSTLETAEKIDKSHVVRWTSRSGKHNMFRIRGSLPSVKECLSVPVPDNSWMSSPPTRRGVLSWTENNG